MDDVPDFDLLNLDDSVFQVQEVVFSDETELFSLTTFLDDYMKKNPTAKSDGVFRGRLVERLRGNGSDVQQVCTVIDKSYGYLTAQYLKAPDHMKSFVMEQQNVKVLESNIEFIKALRKPDTLNNPKLNCCTRALQEGGEKAAVKHFYEALQSKAVHAEKWQQTDCPNLSYMKDKFRTRQKLLQGHDPQTMCALIEDSMRSSTYTVKDLPVTSDNNSDGNSCQCYRCYLDLQTTKITLEPGILDEDGNSDSCSLYLTDIEESSERYLYITRNFALSHLCHLNMLTELNSYFAGVSFPYVYVGGRHSFFPMHVEDMSLWSINFHHRGDPKLFLVVAPCHVLKLSRVLTYYGMSNFHRTCIFKLCHKNLVVFPQMLLHHGISFKIIIQRPGDFIFLAPNAAHSGGNMGVNMAEACNIATPDWLPYGSVAQNHNCSCMESGVHMNITPLIKIHRPELLEDHLNKCMHMAFSDAHFQNSVIVPHQQSAQHPVSVSHQTSSAVKTSSSSTIRKRLAHCRSPLVCPVGGCFTEYKVHVKKTLLNHIKLKHPKEANRKKTLQAVDALFQKKGGPLRKLCEDCGADVSVYSNKHRGSAKCLRSQAQALTKGKNGDGDDGVKDE